jgi:ribosome-associated protein
MIPVATTPTSAMEEELQISKTQRKREMQALQGLGEELVALGTDKLAELDLPTRLLDAVLDAKRISKFGALRRQMQYLGRLMRDADADAIRSQLDVWKGTSVAETARVHAIERWRTRLIGDELALGELLDQYPRADAQRLRALIRNIKREAAAKKPPRSFRELFQELREVVQHPKNQFATEDTEITEGHQEKKRSRD